MKNVCLVAAVAIVVFIVTFTSIAGNFTTGAAWVTGHSCNYSGVDTPLPRAGQCPDWVYITSPAGNRIINYPFAPPTNIRPVPGEKYLYYDGRYIYYDQQQKPHWTNPNNTTWPLITYTKCISCGVCKVSTAINGKIKP